MSDPEVLYCTAPDCDDPQNPGHPRPVFRLQLCQSHAKQKQRTGTTTSIKEKVSDEEKLIDLHDAWMSADGDADWERARRAYRSEQKRQVDAEVKRRVGDAQPTDEQVEAIRLEVLQAAEAEHRQRRATAVKKGQARAREQGRHIGRPKLKAPPRSIDELVRGVYAETRSVSATARALGLNRRTVLDRLGIKSRLSAQPRESPAA